MIREKFGRFWSFVEHFRFLEQIKKFQAKDWNAVKGSIFHDKVKYPVLYEKDFRPKWPRNAEFFPGIDTNNHVFVLENHVWLGSINKKEVTGLTQNHWEGKFINVVKKQIGKELVITSFQVETTYYPNTYYEQTR